MSFGRDEWSCPWVKEGHSRHGTEETGAHHIGISHSGEKGQRIAEPHDVDVRPEHRVPLINDGFHDIRTDHYLILEAFVAEVS